VNYNKWPPGVVQSIVISMFVCLSVCLFVCLHISKTTRPKFTKFLFMLAVTVAWRACYSVVIRYVFPVLWMMSFLYHGANGPVLSKMLYFEEVRQVAVQPGRWTTVFGRGYHHEARQGPSLVHVIAGVAVHHSEYVERAMEQLVEPIMSAVSRLDTDSQTTALNDVITALCDAWTTHILSRKIRFRYQTRHT